MKNFTHIISIGLLFFSLNLAAAEHVIDADYVSELNCKSEFVAVEDEGSSKVFELATFELPEMVVSCTVDQSIMVGMNSSMHL